MTITTCILYCSPRKDSLSKAAGHVLAEAVRERGKLVLEFDIPRLNLGAAGLDDEQYPPVFTDLINTVDGSNVVVLCVPVHRNAISGYSYNLVEFLREPLAGKAVVVIAAMGSNRAHLAAETFRADLICNYAARVVRPIVVTDDLNPDERLLRIEAALAEVSS